MRFPEIEEIVLEAVERLVKAGVSRKAARKAMQDAEFVAMLDVIETQKDQRLLDLFDQCGSVALGLRKGKTDRQMRNIRQQAADRLAEKEIGNNCSAHTSAEAA